MNAAALMRAVYLIFLLSGISGLIYQVVWVRWFGRIFGNTVYSASLVIAVFMCGLGLGSYVVGIWIDRRASGRPAFALRAYAYAELAIAALAALLALLLPALEPMAAFISSYSEDARGWHELSTLSYALRFGIAISVLAPITTLMGGTLTLLVRYLLGTDVSFAGWRIGVLYGCNTAGAALGAFASDFALIPRFGLYATQMLAVVLNLAAALAAFRLLKAQGAPSPETPTTAATPQPTTARDSTSRAIAFTGAAIFLSGFCAMGVEILWFRHFSIVCGSYRSVFSLLLTVVLVGIWIGSVAGGWCHRRLGRPALVYMLTQTAFVVLTMALLASIDVERGAGKLDADAFAASWRYQLLATWDILEPLLLVVGPPALLMGFAYPLANANIQRTELHVGRRAGLLYLANTSGAVLGSLVAGFLLLPRLGLKGSVVALAVFGAASVVSLFLASPRGEHQARGKRLTPVAFAACVACLVVGVALWLRVPNARFQRIGLYGNEEVLAISEGVHELIAVTEEPCDEVRRLKTNGHNMSGTAILAQRYMRAFAHLPLLHLDEPSDVLVICFGVGVTLHAASLHPTVKRLEVADLSRDVLEHAHYFSDANQNVLADPRVEVFVNDGRQHLWMRPEGSYDLITLEPPPPAYAGVSALYTREFYELARTRLREGGFMSQWLPAYQLPEQVVLSMVRAFLDVFPSAILLSGDRRELILVGAKAPSFTIDPVALRDKLARNPALKADLERIHLGTVTEIIGMFFSSSATLHEATRDAEPVTDDYPIMEYAAPATDCWRTRFPEELIDLGSLGTWCPKCFRDGAPSPSVPNLAEYALVLSHYYRSRDFLEFWSCPVVAPATRLPLPPDSEVFRKTTYLTAILSPQ